ncbi:hypothetical protein B0H13DRAFT_2362709 [Mycena leptocephala]|nr:hypothetical protein B0H13DRAFT_2362709 [Mycena leptocephala]
MFVKDALQLHIRILWRLFTVQSIPKFPSQINVAAFEQRFTSADEINTFSKSLVYKHQDTSTVVRALCLAILGNWSIIAQNIANVDESFLHTTFSTIIQFGLLEL